jgi:hypothetical protein
VPRHIVRIDIDKPGLAGTHGWQVRFGRPWRFFSDAKRSRRRSPHRSLEDAINHLAIIYTIPAPRVRATPTARRANIVKEAGIRLVERKKQGRNVVELYVKAMSPKRGTLPRRFYVGTAATVSEERMNAAIVKARQARADMVREHLQAQRERGWI